MIDKKCPVCGAENCDDWPVHAGGEVKLGGCQDCWEKQCGESWHDMVENVGWIKLTADRDRYRALYEKEVAATEHMTAEYLYYKCLAEAAEDFIQARIVCCIKNHLCDADEFQRDFETYTKYNAIKNEREGGE